MDPKTARVHQTLAAMLALSAIAQAQQYGGYYSPANGGSGSGSDFGRGGPDGFRGALGFDIDEASRVRAIHGTLAAVAMVALFPVGSVLVRLMPGRLALWAHAVTQLVATAVYVVAAGLGLHLVRMVQGTFGDMLSDPQRSYHPIIGLVVLGCMLVQPVLGVIHHVKFKRVKRRQLWSYLHLANGRAAITLGIVNGALGLWLARETTAVKTGYLATAVPMWTVWMVIAGWEEWHRWKSSREDARRKLSSGSVSF